MFHTDQKHNKKSPVYRSGRLGSFIYIEGKNDPVDLRDLKKEFNANSVINTEMSKVELARLVSSMGGINEIWDKYKVFIIIGIIILVLILLFRQPKIVIDASLLNKTVT